MENLNKIISLFLGIFVFIILFVVIAGRLNIGKNLANLKGTSSSKNTTLTPTIAIVRIKKTTYNRTVSGVKSIPSTGPVFLIPLAFSSLALGIYLKKKS